MMNMYESYYDQEPYWINSMVLDDAPLSEEERMVLDMSTYDQRRDWLKKHRPEFYRFALQEMANALQSTHLDAVAGDRRR